MHLPAKYQSEKAQNLYVLLSYNVAACQGHCLVPIHSVRGVRDWPRMAEAFIWPPPSELRDLHPSISLDKLVCLWNQTTCNLGSPNIEI